MQWSRETRNWNDIQLSHLVRCAVIAGLLGCAHSPSGPRIPALAPARSVAEFEDHLERLRVALDIPAYSAAMTNGTSIVWAKGFGLADVAGNVKATSETEYHLASLTKTFASTILLQLVDEGKLSLDDPVSKYGISLASPGTILVRHLMSHTSEGVPGSHYNYNGARFGLLDSVIKRITGETFASRLASRVLKPLAFTRTAPNPLSFADFPVMGFDRTAFVALMAKPYDRQQPSAYPSYFGTAAGLVSTATEYAAYSIAMDTNAFLKPATKAMAFAPTLSAAGDTLPYGLGWFSTRVGGERIVWHYGYWTGNSSLVIKVPGRNIAFVIMANNDMLSRPTSLGSGDLMSSSVAREFINAFVVGTAVMPTQRLH